MYRNNLRNMNNSLNKQTASNIHIFGCIIRFRDLGYVPINGALSGKLSNPLSAGAVGTFDAEDDDRGCGPIGPPAIDYIPGTINQEIMNDDEDGIQTDEDYEQSDEEDEAEDPESGIFARLRSSAQKYGLPCGVV